MERLQLKAQIRKDLGKGAARRIRQEGLIPGVIYGKATEPLALTLDPHELDQTIKKAGGTNALFELTIDGKKALPVMIREFQADVLDRHFLHVDFLKVDLKKKIKVQIPVQLVGKAEGVKEGGILDHIRRTLEMICLPTEIPERIQVDVSSLQIGDTIHVHDLKLPEGAELVSAIDVTIAAVVAPVEEKVEEVVEEVAAEPEVIGEKKAEEGEGAEKKEAKEGAKGEGKEEKKS